MRSEPSSLFVPTVNWRAAGAYRAVGFVEVVQRGAGGRHVAVDGIAEVAVGAGAQRLHHLPDAVFERRFGLETQRAIGSSRRRPGSSADPDRRP